MHWLFRNTTRYDYNYELASATFGTPNYTTPGFTANNANDEKGITHDENGNIQALQRSGTFTDNFTYTYQTNSNKLLKVTNNTSTVYDNYTYNEIGQLSAEMPGNGDPVRYMNYNMRGLVTGVYADKAFTQPKVTFVYNESGQRIIKHGWVHNLITYYVLDANGRLMSDYTQSGTGAISQSEVPMYANDRIGMFQRASATYQYELTDYLGNVRAIIDQARNIQYYADYYAYSATMRSGGTSYRYGFQGKIVRKMTKRGGMHLN